MKLVKRLAPTAFFSRLTSWLEPRVDRLFESRLVMFGMRILPVGIRNRLLQLRPHAEPDPTAKRWDALLAAEMGSAPRKLRLIPTGNADRIKTASGASHPSEAPQQNGPARAQPRRQPYVDFVRELRGGVAERANFSGIVLAYNPILDDYREVTEDHRKRLRIARWRLKAFEALQQAIDKADDATIVTAFEALLVTGAIISPSEMRWVTEANQRTQFRVDLERALTKGDEAVFQLVKPMLVGTHLMADDNLGLSPTQIEAIDGCVARHSAWMEFSDAISADADDRLIANTYTDEVAAYPRVTPEQRQRAERSIRRLNAVGAIKVVIDGSDDKAIVDSYDPVLDDMSGSQIDPLRPWMRERIALARSRIEAHQELRAAYSYDRAIARVWALRKDILLGCAMLSREESEWAGQAERRNRLLDRFKKSVDNNDYAQALEVYEPELENSTEYSQDYRAFHQAAYRSAVEASKNAYVALLENEGQESPNG